MLTANFTTLAEVLRQLGYETVGFSSNTFVSDKFGLARGFERFMYAWQLFQTQTDMAHVQEALSDYQGWRKAQKFVQELTRENTLQNMINGVYGKYVFQHAVDYGAQRVNRHIKAWYSRYRDQERPFFLFVNYMEAHLKYDPPGAYRYLFMPENIRKSDVNKVNQKPGPYLARQIDMNKQNFDILEALYNGSIRYLDYIIQDILNFLENDLDNSIVIVTSDHGENIGDHHLMGHYYGLQETLIHIPLIMKLPGQTGGQRTVSRLVQLVDIFPTVVEILGHEEAGLREQFQGSSLLSDHGRAYAVAELLAPSPPVETLARWASVVPESLRSQYERRLRAIRGPRFKYVWASDEQEELYDVVADPDESRNLVDEMESTLAEFRHYRQEWEHQQGGDTAEVQVAKLDPLVQKRLEDLGYL